METVTAHSSSDIFKEQKRHVNKPISSTKSSYYTAKIIEAASDGAARWRRSMATCNDLQWHFMLLLSL